MARSTRLTSRRKRPLDRTADPVRDTRLIIVAIEGEKTEKKYFDMFRNVRVQLKVLSTGSDHTSAPEYVLERLDEFKASHEFEPGDEFWFVTDVDRWGSEKLSQVTREAVQKDYGLAISNPCFECWLFLHLNDPPPEWQTCRQFKQGLNDVLHGNTAALLERVPDAIRRAKALDTRPTNRWPASIGSHVYKVVTKIRES